MSRKTRKKENANDANKKKEEKKWNSKTNTELLFLTTYYNNRKRYELCTLNGRTIKLFYLKKNITMDFCVLIFCHYRTGN